MSVLPNLLINLPPTFFAHKALEPEFARLSERTNLRFTSHNTEVEIAADLSWADAVIMWSWPTLTNELLDRAPKLKYIGQINAGRDTARNCLERKLPLSDARHAWSPAVAEFALSLILAGLRRTSDFHRQFREGEESWVEMSGFPRDIDERERELTGASVGLVGFGGIGRRLAELMRPFEVDLCIVDPFVSVEDAESYHARKVELPELLSASEVIVLAAANTPENDKMLGARELAMIQPNAVLVNTARSMLLDTEALLARLRKNDLIYMVDVFDQEPLEAESEFRRLPNVYGSPHRAGGIIPSLRRSIRMLEHDLWATLEGTTPKYAVQPHILTASLG